MNNNFEVVKQIKRREEARLLAMDGVHGVSIGENKDKPGEFCIYLHVERASIAKDVAASIEGIRIVNSIEPQSALHADEKRYRPLVGGAQVEVKSAKGIYGTLGCLVKDNETGKDCVLSNKHVLKFASEIVGQPKASEVIGETIRTSGDSPLVDGAIAEVDKTSYEASILEIGPVLGTYDVTPHDIMGMGYPIRKRGRTTGLTHSHITRIDYSGKRSDGWNFKNQLYVSPAFAQPGDSGAVYVDNKNRIVGLHWGGNEHVSIGSPIADVLNCLRVSVLVAFGTTVDLRETHLTKPVEVVA